MATGHHRVSNGERKEEKIPKKKKPCREGIFSPSCARLIHGGHRPPPSPPPHQTLCPPVLAVWKVWPVSSYRMRQSCRLGELTLQHGISVGGRRNHRAHSSAKRQPDRDWGGEGGLGRGSTAENKWKWAEAEDVRGSQVVHQRSVSRMIRQVMRFGIEMRRCEANKGK
jgi:hypothetical protein